MTTAKKFFDDNITRLHSKTDPIQYNLNCGLRSLCEQLDRMERRQQDLETQLQRALQKLSLL